MAVIVATADAAGEAALEAMGFNAFAQDLLVTVQEMAAVDADEAVLEALGFNAIARELQEIVHGKAAALVVDDIDGLDAWDAAQEAASWDAMEPITFTRKLIEFRMSQVEVLLDQLDYEEIGRALEQQRKELSAAAAAAAAMAAHVRALAAGYTPEEAFNFFDEFELC